MKTLLLGLFLTLIMSSCQENCDESLRIGEAVQIPLEFVGFTLNEINDIKVYYIDDENPGAVDTFSIKNILWAHSAQSFNETITDRPPAYLSRHYDYYESYLNNCSLIFDWHSKQDTLANLKIEKSQEAIVGCHADAPNVQIDLVSFMHKGAAVSKGQSIQIIK